MVDRSSAFPLLMDEAEVVSSVALDFYLVLIGKTRAECEPRWLFHVKDDIAHHVRQFFAARLAQNNRALATVPGGAT